MKVYQHVNRWLTDYVGFGTAAVIGIVIALALAGAVFGALFPKYEASALLQFPEPPRQGDQKGNAVELTAFKRVAAAYSSTAQLKTYVDASGVQQSPAAARLLVQSERSGFWEKAASPVLPFTKRDQREFGDIKDDAAATILLGLDLTSDARTEPLAVEMIGVLSGYFTNAVLRERIRAWVLAGLADSQGSAKAVQAEIVRFELDVQLLERRTQDMKAILAKYPDAARMDARQVVSVNPSEGGERFLSPLAQLVGFESAISQRREQIRRWERDLKQKQLLASFFTEAQSVVDASVTVDKLLSALRQIGAKKFATADSSQEWAQEAALRVNAALDSFSVALSQFGVRNGVRTNEVASRSPARLALLLAVLGVVGIGAIAFLRVSLRATQSGQSAT